MKSFLFLILPLVCLSACSDALFTEPMPPGKRDRPTFPKALRGEWSGEGDVEDLFVGANYLLLGEDRLELGSEMRLRRLAGFYVLSIMEEDSDGLEWMVIPFDLLESEHVVAHSFDPKDEDDLIVWQREIGLEVSGEKKEGETTYLLSPTKAEFKALLKYRAFGELGTFRKVQ